jgi:hypothetical protein
MGAAVIARLTGNDFGLGFAHGFTQRINRTQPPISLGEFAGQPAICIWSDFGSRPPIYLNEFGSKLPNSEFVGRPTISCGR